jgi:hypothetical protein
MAFQLSARTQITFDHLDRPRSRRDGSLQVDQRQQFNGTRSLCAVCERKRCLNQPEAEQCNPPGEQIDSFGSLRKRDCFVAWMRCQITDGMAEKLIAPADAGERWFRHTPTGSLWRLISENPYGPGFWPANENNRPRKTTCRSFDGLARDRSPRRLARGRQCRVQDAAFFGAHVQLQFSLAQPHSLH